MSTEIDMDSVLIHGLTRETTLSAQNWETVVGALRAMGIGEDALLLAVREVWRIYATSLGNPQAIAIGVANAILAGHQGMVFVGVQIGQGGSHTTFQRGEEARPIRRRAGRDGRVNTHSLSISLE